MRPLYSATLLVAWRIAPCSSATTSPSGAATTTPHPAGQGFPRAPPSILTVKDFCMRTAGLRLGAWDGSDEIQDALTAVALDDRIVAPDLLRDMRPQTHVARHAELAGHGSDADAAPLLAQL